VKHLRVTLSRSRCPALRFSRKTLERRRHAPIFGNLYLNANAARNSAVARNGAQARAGCERGSADSWGQPSTPPGGSVHSFEQEWVGLADENRASFQSRHFTEVGSRDKLTIVSARLLWSPIGSTESARPQATLRALHFKPPGWCFVYAFQKNPIRKQTCVLQARRGIIERGHALRHSELHRMPAWAETEYRTAAAVRAGRPADRTSAGSLP
jgi:hypothetical protein